MGLIVCTGMSFAQIAAWDFFGVASSPTPTTVAAAVYNANMDASTNLTRGATATASNGANSFRTQGFQNNGIAVTNTDYFQVTLSASPGYTLSLSTIDAELRGTSTFSASPGVSNQFAYSLNGTTFTLIGSPQMLIGDGPLTQISLSGIAALQNVPEGTTVTLRFYASGQTTTGGWGFYSGAAGEHGLAIGGTVTSTSTPCQTPVTGPTAAGVSICSGNSANLSATGTLSGSTLSWYNVATNGTAQGTGNTFTTGTLTSTTSFWVEEAATGCPAGPRTEVIVTVNPLPTVSAGADQTVCSGANVTLSGSGATSYTWNNGITNGTPFAATATTTYTVTGTDANGCTGTDDVTVTVSGTAPTADAGPDQNVCAGATVSLTATGTGTFTWDNGVQQAAPFTATTTTTYTVTVDNGVCTNTDQVTIFVSQPSVAGTATVSDLTPCLNDVLTASVTGQTGNVQWMLQFPGMPGFNPAATGSSYTTPPLPLTGVYNVKAVVTNGNCPAAESPVITVTVNALPTVGAGADQAVCAGTAVTLNGSGASTYAWNNGVTNNTAFTPTATTTYTVTGTDANGCTNTDQVIVTVNANPTVSAADQTACAGTGISVTASGAATYTWSPATGLSATTGATVTANPTATTTYTVTGTSAAGCVGTDQVTVTITPAPVATVSMASGAVLTASPAGMTYQWFECVNDQPVSNATSQVFSPTANGQYKVRVTNAQGCSATSDCITTTSVGLEETKADTPVTLFPNPTKGKVTISMAAGDNANVVVYNALGKVVATVNNAQNGSVIDLSSSQAGVYMIQVSGDKGSVIHRIVRN